MGIVQSRYSALMFDPLNLYNVAYDTPNPGATGGSNTTWVGHQDAFDQAQQGLRNQNQCGQSKGLPDSSAS